MASFYVPLEVIKLLLKTFSRIFYISLDISTQKLKWNILYAHARARARARAHTHTHTHTRGSFNKDTNSCGGKTVGERIMILSKH